MNLNQLFNEGCTKLTLAGDPDAELDAKQLLLSAFGLDMVHYLMNRMQSLGEESDAAAATERYREMIKKRCRRIPLQQILGYQEFMGLNFYINKHVLIPRQDTETLVEQVLADHPEREVSVLDLGTGSGCIAVSLAVKGGYQKITAADISAEALQVARKNAETLVSDWKQRMSFVQGDLFAALDAAVSKMPFDIIVSNPPYIPTAVIHTLEPEVKEHEPNEALDGSEDGLKYYRRIAAEAADYGKPGGSLYLEIGHDQGAAVSKLLSDQGYRQIVVFKDLPGKDRVVRAYLP